MNADVSIQADRLIQVSGTFTDGELRMQQDRNLTMQLVGKEKDKGGILLRGMAIRTQGTGRVELRTAGKDQPIETDRITTAGGSITLAGGEAEVRLRGALETGGGRIAIAGKKVKFQAPQSFSGRVDVSSRDIENENRIVLQRGATLAAPGADFENRKNASLEGSGLLDVAGGKLKNDGVLRPGSDGAPGDLRVTGELEMKKEGRLEIDVASPVRYDRLIVSGKAKLDGDLVITAAAYTPASTDSYALVESSSLEGKFDKVNAGSFGGFRAVYQTGRMLFLGAAGSLTPAPVETGSGSGTGDTGGGENTGSGSAGNANAGSGSGTGGGNAIADVGSAGNANGSSAGSIQPAPDSSASSGSASGSQQQEGNPAAEPKQDTSVTGNSGGAPLAPLAEQPPAVQVAVQQPAASTEAFMAKPVAEAAAASESEEKAAEKRRVRVTAVQCRTE
jgi:hypothetical protein